uniref:Transcription factor 25 n=1 Tax=Strigamia maritima TaxID=126957 RepID=T1IJ29_STRMM
MSFRALRKLQGESKLTADIGLNLSESDEADLSPTGGARRKQRSVNPFELLNREQTPSDSEAKEDDDKENEDDKKSGDEDGEKSQSNDSLKRKKKRRRKKMKPAKDKSSEDNNDVEDEIEASVREVNKLLGEPAADDSAHRDSYSHRQRNLYSVEHRYLNSDNEMKKIFGSKIIQAEQNKRRGRGRGHVRSTWLVQPRQNWPHVGKPGISMSLLESRGDVHIFTLEHNYHYQQIQFQFLNAVDSFNPDNIVSILNMHPYHVDALLQLSEICKMADDLQMATALIERALYCFECSFHHLFNIATGNSRLDFRRAENRSFFVAIFKHLVYVGQRGCYRTALEFCKLLLGLDPENDPLCVILMIDFYALRASEYAFLLRMFSDLETERNLSQLPNFAFSVAMATYFLAIEAGKPLAEADKLLQNALLMFPGVLMPLLDKCCTQADSKVTKHQFFDPQRNQPVALTQLIQLYVGRCYHLWKEVEVMTWLENNVNEVIKTVDAKNPIVEQYEEKRQVRYKGTPRAIYRHIIMSEIKDATASLPSELTQTPVMSYDPLPPADAIITYTRPPRKPQTQDERNTLSIFFRSLFPNFTLEESQNQTDDSREAPTDGAGNGDSASTSNTNDLRQSVTSLLDAMRDLLTNIHLPEVAQDADDSDTAHDN